MGLSVLPLSYCTNVHPGRSLAEVNGGLDQFTAPLRVNYGADLAAGLWLAAPVVAELVSEPSAVERFADGLGQRGLSCHTLNAFPYGDFHSRRVKENVYLPDWSAGKRQTYTRDCARILAALLPAAGEGSISTVPLAFKGFEHPADHLQKCVAQLIQTARDFHAIHEETGKLIRLAIEPEPLCLLETTDEAVVFFEYLRKCADAEGAGDIVREHIGLCFDVCHQAVEFEDIPESIRKLTAAGIRINKLHITCALELECPGDHPDARQTLAQYVEERYLHQTLARVPGGHIVRETDLTSQLALHPPREFLDAPAWRVHFHVPVHAERFGALRTTRRELRQALVAVSQLAYAPHLEVETYTWEVLPGRSMQISPQALVDGLTNEMLSTRELLQQIQHADYPVG
ncbi:MAG: metabolite traffic protein EboE [Planctomycetes bacterium]|nr:metabolite traffic protein EboE [Planctomycetota bacterium]